MKVAVDTNFLISSTQWDYSSAHKLLIKLIQANAEIFVTKEIIEEFSEVLERDFKYNSNEIQEIINTVMQFATIIDPKHKVQVVKEDPDDDKVIECAVESHSELIITYDKHLLNLKQYNEIKILKPENVLVQ